MPIDPAVLAKFQGIKRFVVLMLENRSFDHLLGFLKATSPQVDGLAGTEFNQKDPNSPASPQVTVRRASSFAMTFDPAHEYYDVQIQLYGPLKDTDASLPPLANLPSDPAPMTGFVSSATQAVDFSVTRFWSWIALSQTNCRWSRRWRPNLLCSITGTRPCLAPHGQIGSSFTRPLQAG